MCGIVGMIAANSNGFTQVETKMFNDMLFLDTLRGKDSTGVFGVSNEGDVSILKGAMSGPTFIEHTDFKTWLNDMFYSGMFMVGHNRAATRGTVNDANAHPFCIEDKVILVQNGTWNGSHTHIKNTEVDTEALAHVIYEHPDDIEKALQKIDAAYALMWYNVDKKTLYAIHNGERPLHIAETKEGSVLFASELATILYVATRHDIKLKKLPEMLKEGHLYSFTLTDKSQYTSAVAKIDNDFKGERPFRGYYGNCTNYAFGNEVHNYHNSAAVVNYPTQYNKNKFSVTIQTHVNSGVLVQWHCSDSEAARIYTLLSRRESKTHYVEFVDYIEGQFDTNPNCWYLVGVLLEAENFKDNGPLVYATMKGKTEQEVMEYITKNPFHKVETSSPVRMHVDNSTEHVVMMYATSYTPVNWEQNAEETQTIPYNS